MNQNALVIIILFCAKLISFSQNNLQIKALSFIYGKELKKLDKRFDNEKEYPNSKYIIIEVVNYTKDSIFLQEYGQMLCIGKEELFFENDIYGPSTSVGDYFGNIKTISVLPNERKYFLTQLPESKRKKLIKGKVLIEYFTKSDLNVENSQKYELEIFVQHLKGFKQNSK